VKPGAPSISTNATSRDPRESEHIRLTCDSTGGNPAPDVTWSRDGVPLSAGVTVVPASAKFGTTSGLLDVRLSREDDRANFTCDVENRAGSASRTVRLSVQCMLPLSPLVDKNGPDRHNWIRRRSLVVVWVKVTYV